MMQLLDIFGKWRKSSELRALPRKEPAARKPAGPRRGGAAAAPSCTGSRRAAAAAPSRGPGCSRRAPGAGHGRRTPAAPAPRAAPRSLRAGSCRAGPSSLGAFGWIYPSRSTPALPGAPQGRRCPWRVSVFAGAGFAVRFLRPGDGCVCASRANTCTRVPAHACVLYEGCGRDARAPVKVALSGMLLGGRPASPRPQIPRREFFAGRGRREGAHPAASAEPLDTLGGAPR